MRYLFFDGQRESVIAAKAMYEQAEFFGLIIIDTNPWIREIAEHLKANFEGQLRLIKKVDIIENDKHFTEFLTKEKDPFNPYPCQEYIKKRHRVQVSKDRKKYALPFSYTTWGVNKAVRYKEQHPEDDVSFPAIEQRMPNSGMNYILGLMMLQIEHMVPKEVDSKYLGMCLGCPKIVPNETNRAYFDWVAKNDHGVLKTVQEIDPEWGKDKSKESKGCAVYCEVEFTSHYSKEALDYWDYKSNKI